MYETPKTMGETTYQLVQDFSHQQYHWRCKKKSSKFTTSEVGYPEGNWAEDEGLRGWGWTSDGAISVDLWIFWIMGWCFLLNQRAKKNGCNTRFPFMCGFQGNRTDWEFDTIGYLVYLHAAAIWCILVVVIPNHQGLQREHDALYNKDPMKQTVKQGRCTPRWITTTSHDPRTKNNVGMGESSQSWLESSQSWLENS